MFKLIRSVVKYSLFTAIVLLMGQLSIQNKTVGAWFQRAVAKTWNGCQKTIKDSQVFEKINRWNVFSKVSFDVPQDNRLPIELTHPAQTVASDNERMPYLDSQSIIRILQKENDENKHIY